MRYCPLTKQDIKCCADCNICKEQPVKPKQEKAIYDYQSWHYVCGYCDGPIDIQDNYCRHCGKPIEHLQHS